MEKLAPKNALKLLINGKTFALKRLRLPSALKDCTVHSSRSARFCVSGQILLKGEMSRQWCMKLIWEKSISPNLLSWRCVSIQRLLTVIVDHRLNMIIIVALDINLLWTGWTMADTSRDISRLSCLPLACQWGVLLLISENGGWDLLAAGSAGRYPLGLLVQLAQHHLSRSLSPRLTVIFSNWLFARIISLVKVAGICFHYLVCGREIKTRKEKVGGSTLECKREKKGKEWDWERGNEAISGEWCFFVYSTRARAEPLNVISFVKSGLRLKWK